MLKRIGRCFILILQLLLVSLPFWFRDLFNTHLGFMREILFLNENYPMWLIWIVVGVALFVTVGLLGWAKHRIQTKYDWCEWCWLVVLALLLVAVGAYFWYAPEFIYDLLVLSFAVFSQLIVVKLHFKKVVV